MAKKGTPRRKPGSFGPHIEGFRGRLVALGYTPASVGHVLTEVSALGRWMVQEGVALSDLGEQVVEAFVEDRREQGGRRVPGVRSFGPLLDYLRDEDVLAAETAASLSPVDVLVEDYRLWLVVDRGLAALTVLRYEKLARRFLRQHAGVDGGFPESLTGAKVAEFLLQESARVSLGAAKGRVTELRSLLKFLYLTGRTAAALATAVPPVAGWRDTAVPRGITPRQVQALLGSCDRTTPAGARDFAILTLAARLGLRSVEIARLELADIDWRSGHITVQGKGFRKDRLPLPFDVGEALSAYLSDARPRTTLRKVFLTRKAPVQGIRPDLVGAVTSRACDRAGLPRVGAHRLRHALATELLHQGADLAEVSQVLRHRDLATTAVYAKVDTETLRGVAQPWPGAAW